MKRSDLLVTPIILLLAAFAASQSSTPPDPYKSTLDRLEALTRQGETEWRSHTDVPHPEDPGLSDSNWGTLTVKNVSGPGGRNENEEHWKGTRVFRRWIQIPEKVNGYATQGSKVSIDLRFGSPSSLKITVFSNGAILYRGSDDDILPMLLTENAQPGQKFLVAARVVAKDDQQSEFVHSEITIEPPHTRPDPALLRMELLSARPIINAYEAGRAERQQQLDAALKAIDFSPLDRGDQAGFDSSLKQSHAKLEMLKPFLQQFNIRIVGNSHIDMAWLWPWTETVEVVRNTFQSVLDLMREYPDFKFTMSSARTYEWMQEKYPDLFQQIEQRVKEGRRESIGGMWVEPDVNRPDGESLGRQILVGKRYFEKNFGVDVKIGWNPDSFGYNWQLPQIYKKSGIDYFVTQKMSWNETTEFPYKLFWWQSPDGSRVLTYFPHDYDNPRTVDNGIDPVSIAKDVATYVPAMKFPKIMHLYGVGDHGGGPTRAMLDDMPSLRDPSVTFPPISFSTSKAFFADLQQSLNTGALKPPVWNDELYLEYHRGCYTTQSETKQLARQSEELLQNAEKFAALSFLAGHTYPQSIIEESWKKVLFDEFHDILPGSGVAVNYKDAAHDLGEVSLNGERVLGESLAVLTARANTAGAGAPFAIFNPLSWARTGSVVVETDAPGPGRHLEARNAAGELLPSQAVSTDAVTGSTKMRVLARAVPPLGYEVIHLAPVANVRTSPSMLRATGTTLENEFVRVEVDAHTGCITSLVNKADGKNVIAAGGCGNLLQVFVDKPLRQDAWEIRFDQQFWDLKQPQEVKLVESGPVRAMIRVKNKFQNSTFVQDICLYAGVPRVDVEMQVEWHEQHILLKVGVPVDVQTDVATYEIPYGTIQRPTTRRTPAEQAKFEVPALRWGVDLA